MPLVVADATTLADAFIDGKLTPDATIQTEAPGGVWNEAAEQGTSGRIVRYAFQRGATAQGAGAFGPLAIVNDELIYEVLLYLITMVGENDRMEDLAAGATRIKQLLHRSSGSVTGGQILWCRYLIPHKEYVPEGDQYYPERGGYYELTVQATS
jgi:hypothetical protein